MANFVYVGNLDFKLTWQDLKDRMRLPDHTIGCCEVLTHESGKPKGCAFVGYPSEADCQEAVRLFNFAWVNGRQIYVNMATKDQRTCGR